MKTILIVVSLLAIISLIGYNKTKWQLEDKTYCGFIKWKLEEPHHSKYRSWQEPLFVVKFDSVEKTTEINPTWDDFMSLNEGDRVCYKFKRARVEKPENDGLSIIFLIFSVVFSGWWVIIFLLLIFKKP